MNRFPIILLLCALGVAQTASPTAANQPAAAAPVVNLNDSDNARKARTILDRTIQTLGGQPYLAYENRSETGRYYPLYHGRTNSTGIPYNYYVEYPNKDRFEVIHTKDIFLIEGQVGDVKDKQKNVEDEIYDNYKLVQGIWTPHSITRYFNGETSQQRFITTAGYNRKLPDSMFDAAVTYDPNMPLKKR